MSSAKPADEWTQSFRFVLRVQDKMHGREWVSHMETLGSGDTPVHTGYHNGHYISSFDEAVADFNRRCKDEGLETTWGHDGVSYHIRGNHPVRELKIDDMVDSMIINDEPKRIVRLQRGFESLDVAVYGHGLSDSDAREAALEFLGVHHPWALAEEERGELA